MSAITSDWAPSGTEAPTGHAVKSSKEKRREEEFRSALNSYMADYQKHRAVTIGSRGGGVRNTYFTFFLRVAGWILH